MAASRERQAAYAKEYVAKNAERVRAYKSAWYLANKERIAKRQVERRLANPERAKERNASYRKNNLEKIKISQAAYRRANPDIGTKWSRNNREKCCARTMKRKAHKLRATPPWANEFFISEIYHLARLRTLQLGFKWHVDHIVPLKSKLVCGLHVENNLQVVPATYNLQKHNSYWPDMPGVAPYAEGRGGDIGVPRCQKHLS